LWFYRKVQGKASKEAPVKYRGLFRLEALPANAAGATILCTMSTPAAVFTGSAITGPLTGSMMFFGTVMESRKSSSKGGNSHQGRYGKNSFHNWVFELRE